MKSWCDSVKTASLSIILLLLSLPMLIGCGASSIASSSSNAKEARRLAINGRCSYEGLVEASSRTPAGYGVLSVTPPSAAEPIDLITGVFNGNEVSSAMLYLGNGCTFSGTLSYEVIDGSSKQDGIVYRLKEGKLITPKEVCLNISADYPPVVLSRMFEDGSYLDGEGFVTGSISPFLYSRYRLIPDYKNAQAFNRLKVSFNDRGISFKESQAISKGPEYKVYEYFVMKDTPIVALDYEDRGRMLFDFTSMRPSFSYLNVPGGVLLFHGGANETVFLENTSKPHRNNIPAFPFFSDQYTGGRHMTLPLWDLYSLTSFPDNHLISSKFNSDCWNPVIQMSFKWEGGPVTHMMDQVEKTKKGYVSVTHNYGLFKMNKYTKNLKERAPLKNGYYEITSGSKSGIGNLSLFFTGGQGYSLPFVNMINKPLSKGILKINSNELIIKSIAAIQIIVYDNMDGNVIYEVARLDPRVINGPSAKNDIPFRLAEGATCALKNGVTYNVPVYLNEKTVNCAITSTTKYWPTPRIVDLGVSNATVTSTVSNGVRYGDPYPPYRVERTMTFRFNLNELAKKMNLKKVELAIYLYDYLKTCGFDDPELGSALAKTFLVKTVDVEKGQLRKLSKTKTDPINLISRYLAIEEYDEAQSAINNLFQKASSLKELYDSFVSVYPKVFPDDERFNGNEPLYFLNGVYGNIPVLLFKNDLSGSRLFSAFVTKREELMRAGSDLPDAVKEPLRQITHAHFTSSSNPWASLSRQFPYPEIQSEMESTLMALRIDSFMNNPTFEQAKKLITFMATWEDKRKDAVIQAIHNMVETAYDQMRGYIISDWMALNTTEMHHDLEVMKNINRDLQSSGGTFSQCVDDSFVREADSALALLEAKGENSVTFEATSPFIPIAEAMSYTRMQKKISAEINKHKTDAEVRDKEAVFDFFGFKPLDPEVKSDTVATSQTTSSKSDDVITDNDGLINYYGCAMYGDHVDINIYGDKIYHKVSGYGILRLHKNWASATAYVGGVKYNIPATDGATFVSGDSEYHWIWAFRKKEVQSALKRASKQDPVIIVLVDVEGREYKLKFDEPQKSSRSTTTYKYTN